MLLLLELREELLVVSQTLLLLRQGPLRWKSKVVMAQEEEWLVVVVVVHLSRRAQVVVVRIIRTVLNLLPLRPFSLVECKFHHPRENL